MENLSPLALQIQNKILEVIQNNNDEINERNNKGETQEFKKELYFYNILPGSLTNEKDFDALIEVLTQNTEIKEEIASYDKIAITSIKGPNQPLNKIIDLINLIKDNELFHESKGEIVLNNFSLEDTFILEIKTNSNFEDISCSNINEHKLLKTTWNKLQNTSLKEIFLETVVNEVIVEINTKEKIDLTYHYCLRILSKFNWSRLSEEHSGLSDNFKHLLQQEKVKSEYFHCKKVHTETEDDPHFYMQKITQKNANFWQEFRAKQQKVDSENGNKFFPGLRAIRPSLEFFEYNKTDVWVAFIANEEVDLTQINHSNFDQINYSAIEMIVTMITSDNSCFTSHSGISRCPAYSGRNHQKISADLHSFIAKATIENYTEVPKLYMITTPVSGMREIIIKKFIEEKSEKYFYIGNEYTNPLHNTSWEGGVSKSDYADINNLVKRIDDQNQRIKDGHKNIPIKIEFESKQQSINAIFSNCTLFEIFDQERNVLQIVTPEMMRGEFAWFFNHLWLFPGQCNSDPLLTTDIEVLSSFFLKNDQLPLDELEYTPETSELEHAFKVEMIGDSVLYLG